MTGSHLCYHHGGAQRRGAAHPNTKHGRYSKDLPERLTAKYEARLLDPNLLSQRHEIAVLQTRLQELLARVDSQEAGAWFKAIRKAKDEAVAEPDVVKKQAKLNHLLRLIDRGAEEWMIWDDIDRVLERHRRIVGDQDKAEQNALLLISLEKLILIFGTWNRLIHEHVTDRTARLALKRGLDPIFSELVPGYDSRSAGDA